MPTPEQRYLDRYPDITPTSWKNKTARQHYDMYGKDQGRIWEYEAAPPVSYIDRTREVFLLETGREPTQEELDHWSNEVRQNPSLLNDWFTERQRLGLEVPEGWGGEQGWNPGDMVQQEDPWSRIEQFIGEDFKIDLDPEGKWGALEDVLLKQAREGVDPSQWASQAATDVKAAHKGQEAAIRRDAGRMGINPASGAFGAALQDSGLGLARDQSTAMNQARFAAEDMNRNLRDSAMQHGLQAQDLRLRSQLAEEGARLERAGLGLDMHKYNIYDRHHQDNLGLRWGELGHRFYDTDMTASMDQSKLDAKGRSDLWGGAATLGVGLLSNMGGDDGWWNTVSSWWD